MMTFNTFGIPLLPNTQFYLGSSYNGIVSPSTLYSNFPPFDKITLLNNYQFNNNVFNFNLPVNSLMFPTCFTTPTTACNISFGFFSNATASNRFWGTGTYISLQASGQTCNAINCSALTTDTMATFAPVWGDTWQIGSCPTGYHSAYGTNPTCYCNINGIWQCPDDLTSECNITFVGCPAIITGNSQFQANDEIGLAVSDECVLNYSGSSSMECLYNNTWDINSWTSSCGLLPQAIPQVDFLLPLQSVNSIAFSFEIQASLNFTVTFTLLSLGYLNRNLTTLDCDNGLCQLNNFTITNLVYSRNYTVQSCVDHTLPPVCSLTSIRLKASAPTGVSLLHIYFTSVLLTWDFDSSLLFYVISCTYLDDVTAFSIPVNLTFHKPQATQWQEVCSICGLGSTDCTSIAFLVSTTIEIVPTVPPTTTPSSSQADSSHSTTIALGIVFGLIMPIAITMGVLWFLYRRHKRADYAKNMPIMLDFNDAFSSITITPDANQTMLNTTISDELRFRLPGHLWIKDLDNELRIDKQIHKGGESVIHACSFLSSSIKIPDNIAKECNHKYVLKQYNDTIKDKDFLAEIKMLHVCLDHKNIARMIAYVSTPFHGIVFPMYQFNFNDMIHSMQWFSKNPRHLIYALHQIISGMTQIHLVGAAHCDLKPNNILVQLVSSAATLKSNSNKNMEFCLKIADFGTFFCDKEECKRVDCSQNYTPAYISPERTSQDFSFTLRPLQAMDVYAFSVTAAEALMMRRPFHGMTHQDMWTEVAFAKKPFTDSEIQFALQGSGLSELISNVIQTSGNINHSARPSFLELGRQLSSFFNMQ